MLEAYTVTLSPDDLKVIAAGLNEMPVKTGAGTLLLRLQALVHAQEQAEAKRIEAETIERAKKEDEAGKKSS
jgi:hypothetical protein